MREVILSHCEKNFVNKAIDKETRLDGRQLLEARPVNIHFGSNWGCCIVSLGRTKAIAQVSCDIQKPKASRPNEGMLHINVELNPMAAPFFEAGRQSDPSVQINRQLERCLKDSKCIDLESLCIVADKKAWNLRVDINIINHDGNLVDCASIAALAALMHFHRPDVSSSEEEIIIHSFAEKDPLPLTIYHHPVCISFLVFENGNTIMDPTYLEEKVGVAQLTMGINSYRELCSLDFNYLTRTSVADVIPTISNQAANYAAELVSLIKESVRQDVEARYKKEVKNFGRFENCIATDKLTAMFTDKIPIKLSSWGKMDDREDEIMEDQKENEQIIKINKNSAELLLLKGDLFGNGGVNTWQNDSSSDDEEESSDEVVMVEETKTKCHVLDDIELSEDSEEEETQNMTKDDIQT
ncbi:exosome complex component RRP45 [Cephus cinctus]|uniref:Exosome complex component RRP45 n=1 Tax=Cephus cinctus TaxID=211228 RepID=A0AAJ7BXR5_CEPCN|nr:exosome complex component RRP45 [Cephus cinctus]